MTHFQIKAQTSTKYYTWKKKIATKPSPSVTHASIELIQNWCEEIIRKQERKKTGRSNSQNFLQGFFFQKNARHWETHQKKASLGMGEIISSDVFSFLFPQIRRRKIETVEKHIHERHSYFPELIMADAAPPGLNITIQHRCKVTLKGSDIGSNFTRESVCLSNRRCPVVTHGCKRPVVIVHSLLKK